MNIRINRPEGRTPLFESAPSTEPITQTELEAFLANFPDNAKSWKDATGELAAIHRFLAEATGNKYEDAKNPKQDPGVQNKFHKGKIKQYFKKLDRMHAILFAEDYGLWFKEDKHLFESDTSMDNKSDAAADEVLDNKSKQFSFDGGACMGNMQSSVDSQFGLMWHDAKTKDFAGFLESVTDYLKTANIELSSGDKERLKLHYNKYNWRAKLKAENVTL